MEIVIDTLQVNAVENISRYFSYRDTIRYKSDFKEFKIIKCPIINSEIEKYGLAYKNIEIFFIKEMKIKILKKLLVDRTKDIIVIYNTSTPDSKKEFDRHKANILMTYKLSMFEITELQIDIFDNYLNCKPLPILTKDEVIELTKTYKIKNLPKLKVNDIESRCLDLKVGDIIQFNRIDEETKTCHIYYRHVINEIL